MILFINACVRQGSRTKMLADHLLSLRNEPFEEVRLDALTFPAVDRDFLIKRDRLIQEAYRTLRLISFFTVGEDEVRAWTLHEGDDAVTAAGKIHTDLARGFIRAETVRCEELIAKGSHAACREAGTLRL